MTKQKWIASCGRAFSLASLVVVLIAVFVTTAHADALATPPTWSRASTS